MNQSGFLFGDEPVSMASEPIKPKARPADNPLIKDPVALKAAIARYAETVTQPCSIDDVLNALGLPLDKPAILRSTVMQVFTDPINGLFKQQFENGKLRYTRRNLANE